MSAQAVMIMSTMPALTLTGPAARALDVDCQASEVVAIVARIDLHARQGNLGCILVMLLQCHQHNISMKGQAWTWESMKESRCAFSLGCQPRVSQLTGHLKLSPLQTSNNSLHDKA